MCYLFAEPKTWSYWGTCWCQTGISVGSDQLVLKFNSSGFEFFLLFRSEIGMSQERLEHGWSRATGRTKCDECFFPIQKTSLLFCEFSLNFPWRFLSRAQKFLAGQISLLSYNRRSLDHVIFPREMRSQEPFKTTVAGFIAISSTFVIQMLDFSIQSCSLPQSNT